MMNPVYETLFLTYGDFVLKELDSYDKRDVLSHLEQFPLDKDARISLEELLFSYYCRWSTNAFAAGIHLGLSLLCDDIRRLRPQQVQ